MVIVTRDDLTGKDAHSAGHYRLKNVLVFHEISPRSSSSRLRFEKVIDGGLVLRVTCTRTHGCSTIDPSGKQDELTGECTGMWITIGLGLNIPVSY